MLDSGVSDEDDVTGDCDVVEVGLFNDVTIGCNVLANCCDDDITDSCEANDLGKVNPGC